MASSKCIGYSINTSDNTSDSTNVDQCKVIRLSGDYGLNYGTTTEPIFTGADFSAHGVVVEELAETVLNLVEGLAETQMENRELRDRVEALESSVRRLEEISRDPIPF